MWSTNSQNQSSNTSTNKKRANKQQAKPCPPKKGRSTRSSATSSESDNTTRKKKRAKATTSHTPTASSAPATKTRKRKAPEQEPKDTTHQKAKAPASSVEVSASPKLEDREKHLSGNRRKIQTKKNKTASNSTTTRRTNKPSIFSSSNEMSSPSKKSVEEKETQGTSAEEASEVTPAQTESLDTNTHVSAPSEDAERPQATTLRASREGWGGGYHPFSGAGRGRFSELLETLQSDEESQQLSAIMELSDILSMGTEESLGGFSVEQFVPIFMNLLNMEHNPNILLLSARAISNLLEALPGAGASLVRGGIVPILCAKLLCFDYIDLAEQCLLVLEKLSWEHPTALLKAGAMASVLSFLDFFPSGIQRKAVSTAANICRHIPEECFDMVLDTLPVLTNLLQYTDSKLVESACLCFSRLTESFYRDETKLQIISSSGLFPHIIKLLGGQGPEGVTLAPSTILLIVRMLATFCRSAPTLLHTLLSEGLVPVLQGELSQDRIEKKSVTTPSKSPHTPIIGQVPRELLAEILGLIDAMLPPLPSTTTPPFLRSSSSTVSTPPARRRLPYSSNSGAEPAVQQQPPEESTFTLSPSPAQQSKNEEEVKDDQEHKGKQTEPNSTRQQSQEEMSPGPSTSVEEKQDLDPRASIFAEHPELLADLQNRLLSLLVGAFTTTVNNTVRYKCLSCLNKILHYSTSDMLKHSLENIAFSSFIAALLSSGNDITIVRALTMAELLMEKLPDIFAIYFRKEGVVHVVEKICNDPQSLASSPSISSTLTKQTPVKREDVERWIRLHAQQLLSKHFGGGDSATQITDELKQMQDLLTQLNDCKNCIDPTTNQERIEKEQSVLSEIADLINKLSTFEIQGSQLIPTLLEYLCIGGDEPKQSLRELRAQVFASVFLQAPSRFVQEQEATVEPPLLSLVRQLQSVLNKEEALNVAVYDVGNPAASLKLLAQPIKLRLKRDDGKTDILSELFAMLLIEPLATVQDIMKFIWQQLGRSRTPPKPRETRKGAGQQARTTSSNSTNEVGTASTSGELETNASTPKVEEFKMQEEEKSASRQQSKMELLRVFKQMKKAQASSSSGGENNMDAVTEESPEEEVEEEECEEGEDDHNHDHDEDEDDRSYSNSEEEEEEEQYISELDDESHEMAIHPEELELAGNQEEDRPSDAIPTDEGSEAMTIETEGEQRKTKKQSDRTKEKKGKEKKGSKGKARVSKNEQEKVTLPTSQTHSLRLYLNGVELFPSETVFQAMLKGTHQLSLEPSAIHSLWSTEYQITYAIEEKTVAAKAESTPSETQPHSESMAVTQSIYPSPEGGSPWRKPLLGDYYNIPYKLKGAQLSREVLEVLSLLRFLDGLNRLWCLLPENSFLRGPIISPLEFVSTKITAKLARQLQDPIVVCSGAFPEWCELLTSICPFLFPFETRRLLVTCTSFGIARALKSVHIRIHGQELQIGRIERRKVRISREKILESAKKVMEFYAHNKAILEVAYFNEVGVGSGPTLEFFTLVSHELQREDLNMWLSESKISSASMDVEGETQGTDRDKSYVINQGGLFPKPLRCNSEHLPQVKEWYHFLGRFVAKALLDDRQLDLPFSKPFYKLMLGQHPTVFDLNLIFPSLAKSMHAFIKLCNQKRALQQDLTLTEATRSARVDSLLLDGCKIEDLCIDFTLPGYPEWELKSGGKDILLDVHNIEEYVDLVLGALFREGIQAQFEAFKRGFDEVFPLENLKPLTVDELETLVCGAADNPEYWTLEELAEHTRCDHGYVSSSRAVQQLLAFLSELTPNQRRQFLLFLTGSPRLPVGGWKNLEPRFTIVRKEVNKGHSPDDHLPSVMTCVNYLKLPDYSTDAILRAKLLKAIAEGGNEFHLS
ncbi:Thyroid receptor-interacting protein 12 [Balamuthia mandrillaris]